VINICHFSKIYERKCFQLWFSINGNHELFDLYVTDGVTENDYCQNFHDGWAVKRIEINVFLVWYNRKSFGVILDNKSCNVGNDFSQSLMRRNVWSSLMHRQPVCGLWQLCSNAYTLISLYSVLFRLNQYPPLVRMVWLVRQWAPLIGYRETARRAMPVEILWTAAWLCENTFEKACRKGIILKVSQGERSSESPLFDKPLYDFLLMVYSNNDYISRHYHICTVRDCPWPWEVRSVIFKTVKITFIYSTYVGLYKIWRLALQR